MRILSAAALFVTILGAAGLAYLYSGRAVDAGALMLAEHLPRITTVARLQAGDIQIARLDGRNQPNAYRGNSITC
ncbi:MAG: hypothetical protein ACKO15_00360 [Burkholderiales bacterium]